MEKVKIKLPKEIANQIEALRKCSYSNWSILNFIEKNGVQGAVFKNWISEETEEPNDRFDIFLQALVNGYEVEETPEDKVKELFNYFGQFGVSYAGLDVQNKIQIMLTSLNIKIEGIN